MSIRASEKQAKLFAEYIKDKKILIADTAATSRAAIAKTLISMGASSANIAMVNSFEHAEAEMKRLSPHVVLCDFALGPRCGLDLLQQQRATNPNTKESLFILVTGNSSQSVVAQAAEEDVDSFVLKPFTSETLRQAIQKAALIKIYPSDYQKKIDEGKKLLLEMKPTESKPIFEEAMKLDPKPALAHFYHGQAELMEKSLQKASKDYETGLSYNKIHYKCLVGLFEVFMDQKLYGDAYEVVKKISRYFPANPQRLTQVLRLAIMTQNYDDIERYYQNFIELDVRNDELVKYICAALAVCGKFYLKKDLKSRALELFQKAAVTAAGRVKVLREIVQALLDYDMAKEAQDYLARFPATTHLTADFLAMQLSVQERFQTPQITVRDAQSLISKNVQDPSIHTLLIKNLATLGKSGEAEAAAQAATKIWANRGDEFARLAKATAAPATNGEEPSGTTPGKPPTTH